MYYSKVRYRGAVLDVDSRRWDEADRLQLMAGRMVLGVGREVADEVGRGGLGVVDSAREERVPTLGVLGRYSTRRWHVYAEGRISCMRVKEGRQAAGGKE